MIRIFLVKCLKKKRCNNSFEQKGNALIKSLNCFIGQDQNWDELYMHTIINWDILSSNYEKIVKDFI